MNHCYINHNEYPLEYRVVCLHYKGLWLKEQLCAVEQIFLRLRSMVLRRSAHIITENVDRVIAGMNLEYSQSSWPLIQVPKRREEWVLCTA
jgi:hypothetical protein